MNRSAILACVVLVVCAEAARAQDVVTHTSVVSEPAVSVETSGGDDNSETASPLPSHGLPGLPLPNSQQLRFRAGFMAGYGHDGANAALGFEKQGRVGYALLTIEGRPTDRVFFRLTVNPVNETEPLPACGEDNYFFPNNPQSLYGAGPRVQCEPKNGHRRVDAYRGIALDVVGQQGQIREAFVDLSATRDFSIRFGRTMLPLGIDWEHAGSFTSKDAPRIQRINAEANFGLMFTYVKPWLGRKRPVVSARLAAFLGEGNRWHDYDYFYFEDGSLDANSALTALVAGTFSPFDALGVHASYKKGFTGSKVERLPSYWASKRNDDAVVVGVSYETLFVRAFAEYAKYTWGATATSADMLGMNRASVEKAGYWGTLEGRYPVFRNVHLGASVTRESLDRADALVRWAAENNLYRVVEGKKDGMSVLRVFVDVAERTRIGFYRTMDSNPFPQLSGIAPISGPRAYTARSTDKWGIVLRLRIE